MLLYREEAVRAAEAVATTGRAASVSTTWVASAASERAHREKLAHVLAEIRVDLKPAAKEETAWALRERDLLMAFAASAA